jgi:hypothetical protein
MSKAAAVAIVIVGALLLACATTLAVMLYRLDFFKIRLTSWYDVAIAILIATAGMVLLAVGARALLPMKRNRTASWRCPGLGC